jgi:putative FmdB family regulatory protein
MRLRSRRGRTMPFYDYLCAKCGPFTDMRPMVESSLPLGCPGCGKKAPRAFLTAPYFATTSPNRGSTDAAGERSASRPRSYSDWQRSHGGVPALPQRGSTLDAHDAFLGTLLPFFRALDRRSRSPAYGFSPCRLCRSWRCRGCSGAFQLQRPWPRSGNIFVVAWS